VRTKALLFLILLVSFPAVASAKIEWRKDIRAAYEEAEARGVAIFVYFTRDD
jgi:hypothetical protein